MKESKLIEMQNRITNLENMLRQMIPELQKLSNVAFGVFETIKLIPGYDKAIEKLKKQQKEAQEKIESEKKFENVE
tara:strand:+ start:674 stop:901 length:228 start_codon:yes stop_codon:yes gene_type:complete